MHRSDDRFRAFGEFRLHGVAGAHEVEVLHRSDVHVVFDVGTSGEAAPAAVQYRNLRVAHGGEVRDVVIEQLKHARTQRVELVGPIQREEGDAILFAIQDRLSTHSTPLELSRFLRVRTFSHRQ